MNDISYFEWLMSLVGIDPRTQARDFMIANELFHIPYRWHFQLDENRAVAGSALREQYSTLYAIMDDDIPEGPCSVLEMLVALAQRMSENSGIKTEDCYHEMIKNLGLYGASLTDISKIVNQWMDGRGGFSLFPLHHYKGNGDNLDLWTQMTIYINENYPLDRDWLK